jgi:hypothetical protein
MFTEFTGKQDLIGLVVGISLTQLATTTEINSLFYYFMLLLSAALECCWVRPLQVIAWKSDLSETILARIRQSPLTLDQFVALTPFATMQFGLVQDGKFTPLSPTDV